MARLCMGMVGGGKDAFIGGVHRIASRIDDRLELVACALSSSAEKSALSAKALNILVADPELRIRDAYAAKCA